MDTIKFMPEQENEEQYIYRICSMKESSGKTWQQIADIINKSLNQDYTESAYRKKYQMFQHGLKACEKQVFTDDEYLENIRAERRELEKERKKLQTEKVEYNRWLREEAREELIAEHISQAIRDLPKLDVPNVIIPKHGTRVGTLAFADPHFGKELCIKGLFGEILNEYSPEIFEKRMWNLLNQVVEICDKENFDTLNVYDLGDEIDGLLRVSALTKLRYGIIESTVLYGRFITEWLNELTKYVRVRYQMVKDSNHCQLRLLNQPKNSFKDENVSYIIAEKIMDRLNGNPNFEFIQNPTGYIFDQIFGYNIFGYHGEGKSLEKAVKDFSNTYKIQIDFLIGGHKHHKSSDNIGIESDVISVPSIIGVDDYSLSLNKTSDPGATLFVLEEGKGNVIEYNIKL